VSSFVCAHAPAVHASSVHGCESSQLAQVAPIAPHSPSAVPPAHDAPFQQPAQQAPPRHTPPGHAAPSTMTFEQPEAPHTSTVHGLVSSHPVATQASAQHSWPAPQRSDRMHVSPTHVAS